MNLAKKFFGFYFRMLKLNKNSGLSLLDIMQVKTERKVYPRYN